MKLNTDIAHKTTSDLINIIYPIDLKMENIFMEKKVSKMLLKIYIIIHTNINHLIMDF